MRSLAGLLADGVLANAILIPPCTLIPPTNINGKGSSKKLQKLVTEKSFTSK